jgi:ribosome-associated protein
MNSKKKAYLAIFAGMGKKGIDPVILDLRGLSSITDYFIILSGNSDRHVMSIAEHIEEVLYKKGILPLSIEGASEGRWILMDYDDIIIHVFKKDVREFYNLEGLWVDVPREEVYEDDIKRIMKGNMP